jgi:hypothetical protein
MTIRNAARCCNKCVALLLYFTFYVTFRSFLPYKVRSPFKQLPKFLTRLLNRLSLAISMEQIPPLEADNRQTTITVPARSEV